MKEKNGRKKLLTQPPQNLPIALFIREGHDKALRQGYPRFSYPEIARDFTIKHR